jgi:hypothetical protein
VLALWKEELCDLQWSQVELTTGRLHVRRAKNGSPSVHPMQGDEIRALRRLQREQEASPHVFASERGGPMSAKSTDVPGLPKQEICVKRLGQGALDAPNTIPKHKSGKARIDEREGQCSPPAHRGALVIRTDALRFMLISQEPRGGQERKQDSEDDPDINAHQSSPAAALPTNSSLTDGIYFDDLYYTESLKL